MKLRWIKTLIEEYSGCVVTVDDTTDLVRFTWERDGERYSARVGSPWPNNVSNREGMIRYMKRRFGNRKSSRKKDTREVL